MDATETVNRLQFQQYAEEQNLRESSARFGSVSLHIEEETLDSASPIADSFLDEGGPEAILTMINFSVEEFTTLWGIVEVEMQLAWTMGRGRKRETTPRDAFFMALTVLKHYDTWAKHAVDFRLQTATFEKMMYKVFEIIEPVLFEHYVRPAAMAEQRAAGNTFANYPYALYATDVTFQPAYRPAGSFIEQKQYFSGKHKLYGYKLKCSVAYPGFAVDVSVHAPGSKSDLTIMMERVEVHRSMLKKTRAERAEPDVGEGAREYPDEWAVLVDMGYQGAQSHLRTVQPKRKPRGGTLNHDDLARNDRVASDRVLVENFFGRMSKLWCVMYATYKWNECRYDQLSRLCVALTNAHAHLHPLRLQDRDHYRSVLARYVSMGNERREKRARTQRNYRMRLSQRLRPTNFASPARTRCSPYGRTQNDSEHSQEYWNGPTAVYYSIFGSISCYANSTKQYSHVS